MGGFLSLLKGTQVELKKKNSEAVCSQEVGRSLTGVIKKGKSECILTEDYRTLKIATHNINRIKGSFTKLELLLEWAVCKNLDIIRINETNTMERQNKFNMKKQNIFSESGQTQKRKKKKDLG